MKTLTSLIGALVLVLGMATPGHAQTQTACFTTLNGSISATQTTLVLTSASTSTGCSFGSAAIGQGLFMDAELMVITGVSGTTMTVRRDPTSRPTPHYTGAVIFRALPSYFMKAEPPVSGNPLTGGNVTCSQYPAPWINLNTANVWFCNTKNNQWNGTNFRGFANNSVPTAQ